MNSYPEPLTSLSRAMPKNVANNFWYIQNESDKVIVFLHGIFSESRGCWLYEDSSSQVSVFWPDLILNDECFNKPSIFLAGYSTSASTADYSIADCAQEVFDALARPGNDGEKPVLDWDSIIFVCHSTGGVVARYMLNQYRETFRDKCIGLALIASPALGSVWANIASFAAKYYHNILGYQLRVRGESLDTLHGEFKNLVNKKNSLMPWLFGMEACETEMVFRKKIPGWIKWILPIRMKVVSTLSAGQYFGPVHKLVDTDHFSTVKPDSISHPGHIFLETFISEYTKVMEDFHQKKPVLSNAQRELLTIIVSSGHEGIYAFELMKKLSKEREAIVFRCLELEQSKYITVSNKTDYLYKATKKGQSEISSGNTTKNKEIEGVGIAYNIT